ncbi:PEP-CTERM sorting domain-containing protein [Massilia yuzhufengensis]|uniref:PEP-CTERM protein-sorting domain-containing protein n=1 Tax=Massilia yuzhufengensis TaxID=1164594 RepID=A0A1I1WKX9_9BURK|nr:PEP-CTERM sorting domain-containing protein [Massilia yuzhufengensis]SFD95732.1 PEP-CTERM protein-sorting domain-containing protein [Massilia yuzhufengensis]
MSLRRLVIAALLASAGAVHADTITSTTAPPTFVSGWTSSNGTDVLSSGVLKDNVSLIGGVSHGADSSLTEVMFGKVAATVGKVDGETKIFFERGIDATYMLASGHGIMAAITGVGTSVVGSADGAIIKAGVSKGQGLSGGGSASGGGGGSGGSGGGWGGDSGGGQVGGGDGGGTGASSGGSGGGSGSQGGGSNGSTGGANPHSPNIGAEVTNPIGSAPGLDIGNGNIGNGNGAGIGGGQLDQVAAAVPEPSSIALMLAGVMGAGALSRRRRTR